MATATVRIPVDRGVVGLAGTLAYAIAGPLGTHVARTTVGVTADAVGGKTYYVDVEIDTAWVGAEIVWDDGTRTARESLAPYQAGIDAAVAAASGFGAEDRATLEELSALATENLDAKVSEASVTITPYVASTSNPRAATRDLAAIPQGSGPTDLWTITDATGAAIDLSAKTVRFVVAETTDDGDDEDPYDDDLTALYQYETGTDSNISVGGASGNQVSVRHLPANTATAGLFLYWLWDVTTAGEETVLAKGKMPVTVAKKST